MFDPNQIKITRKKNIAKRKIHKWSLEIMNKEKNKEKYKEVFESANINVREIHRTVILCNTNGSTETVISVTTPYINVMGKISKSVIDCTHKDIIKLVSDLFESVYTKHFLNINYKNTHNKSHHILNKVNSNSSSNIGKYLLENDDDEAKMTKTSLKCPCCNPNDPKFIADKFLIL